MNHGGTEMGQGLFQKVAQVAASRFGIDVGVVKITATDTGKVPNTSATAASSGTDLNGMAVAAACDTIRDRMAAFLAQMHGVSPADVTFAGGRVSVGADQDMSFADAALIAYQNRISLSATGFYKTPDLEWDRIKGKGRPFFYFAQGAAITEVVLDTLTGENRILRCDILHDAGSSLNTTAAASRPTRRRPTRYQPAAIAPTSLTWRFGTPPIRQRRSIAQRPWASHPLCTVFQHSLR